MDQLMLDILKVTALLLAGSAMRFILPYIVVGLAAVGEKNTWTAWPAWQWKYVTSIILAMLGYGIAVVANPESVAEMLSLTPMTIVGLAYFGQDMASQVIKFFRRK
jgi:hypothetical protein